MLGMANAPQRGFNPPYWLIALINLSTPSVSFFLRKRLERKDPVTSVVDAPGVGGLARADAVPFPRQQFVEPGCEVVVDAGKHVGEPDAGSTSFSLALVMRDQIIMASSPPRPLPANTQTV